jgi:hypothetical protein
MGTEDGNSATDNDVKVNAFAAIKNNTRMAVIAGALTIFSLFGAFYTFDSIYARAASVKAEVQSVRTEIKGDMLQWQITDLEDQIFMINMKTDPSQADKAMKERYEERLRALRALQK